MNNDLHMYKDDKDPKLWFLVMILIIIFCLLATLPSCKDATGTPREIKVEWSDTCVYREPMGVGSTCQGKNQYRRIFIASGQTYKIKLTSIGTCILLPRPFDVRVYNDGKLIHVSANKNQHDISVYIK